MNGNKGLHKFARALIAGFVAIGYGAVTPAHADSFSTSGGSVFSIGDQIGSTFDQIVLDPFSGVLNGAGTYVLNPLHFIVGINATQATLNNTGSFSEMLTIGSETQTLTIPFSVDINYSDTLRILGGSTLAFSGYTVTLNSLGPVTQGVGTYDAALTATVAAVPEPEIYAMMMAGLGLLGWHTRRKNRKESAAA
jgi:PEP-CTERM motif